MSDTSTSTFRIAHFTDAHIPQHGGFHIRDLTGKRIFSALNWARARRREHVKDVADALRADILAHHPDHVAMTGDVVNFGLPREFEAGARWLHEFGPAEALSFTPGNHEAINPGMERARDAAFAVFTTNDDGDYGFPYVRRRGPVAFIGVSTSIATPPFFAQGEAGPAQIERLRAALKSAADLRRIVLIHHPPTEMSSKRRALRDRAAVVSAIADEGAELVLHGHNHRNQMSWIDGAAGRIPVLGAPSASSPPNAGREPAEWRLLTVTDEGFAVERRALNEQNTLQTVGRFTLTSPQA